MSLQKGHLRFDLPCPHCGKGTEGKHNWCYQAQLEDGNVLSVCKRNAEPAEGWQVVKNGQTHDSEGYAYYIQITEENKMKSQQQFIQPKKESRLNGQKEKWTQYNYYSEDGKPFIVVKRRDYINKGKETKDCYVYHHQGNKLVKGLGGNKQIPVFGYQTIKQLPKDTPIFICEGEETVNALRSVGLFAVTNLGGSKRWTDYNSQQLREYTNLIVSPDMDMPGLEFADKIAASLTVKWSYAYDELAKTHGLDYQDYILDQRKKGKSDQEIKKSILDKIEDKPREWTHIQSSKKGTGFQQLMDRDQVWDKIHWIIENIRGERKLDIEFSKLIGHGGCRTLKDVKYMFYKALELVENEQLKYDALDYHKDILFFKSKRINLEHIFGFRYADSIRRKMKNIGVKKMERAIGYLFGSLSAVIGGKMRMNAKRNAEWYEPARIYYADVASASSSKTPLQRATTKYLSIKQTNESDRYELAKERLEDIIKPAWDAMDNEEKQDNIDNAEVNPKLYERQFCQEIHYIFNNATIEGMVAKLVQRNKYEGIALIKDELAGFFDSQGQYKQGKGDDKATILELWNPDVDTRRVFKTKDTLRFKEQRLSIMGGIQEGILRQYLNLVSNEDGMVCRFLYCVTEPETPEWSDLKEDLILLEDVLKLAESIELEDGKPINCHFNDAAYLQFVRYWRYLQALSTNECITNHVLASYAKKLPSYLLVFSMLIQFIKYSEGEVDRFKVVDLDSLNKAWELIEFYLGQFLLIQAKDLQRNTPIGKYQEILAYLELKGEVSSREITRKFNRKIDGQKMCAALAHEIMDYFVECGLAEEIKEGKGRRIKYKEPSGSTCQNFATGVEGTYSKALNDLRDTYLDNPDKNLDPKVTPLNLVVNEDNLKNNGVEPELSSNTPEPLPDIEQESVNTPMTVESEENMNPSDYIMGESYLLNVQYDDPSFPPKDSEVILSSSKVPFKEESTGEWIAEIIYQGQRLYSYLKHLTVIPDTSLNS